jgi:hypothetical protein
MKKFLLIGFLSILTIGLTAQTTVPRFGIDKHNDNTGRVLTYGYLTPTFTTTLKVTPNAYETIVATASLTGACTINATVTSCYAGDKLTFILQADTLTAGRVVTLGGNFVYKASGSTITVAANKRATISFIFDPNSLKFVELTRTVQ